LLDEILKALAKYKVSGETVRVASWHGMRDGNLSLLPHAWRGGSNHPHP
jgi:hypothetical protein